MPHHAALPHHGLDATGTAAAWKVVRHAVSWADSTGRAPVGRDRGHRGGIDPIYPAQPLLDTIAADLDVSTGTAGLLVTASQVGFAVGLAFLVPLGDLRDRRKLIAGTLATSAVVSVAAALTREFSVLCAVLFLAGLTAAAAQIVVPFAASLADESERGRITTTVMFGLL